MNRLIGVVTLCCVLSGAALAEDTPLDSGGFLLDNDGSKREKQPRFCKVPDGTVAKDATYRATAC